jgi:ATP-dependent DNA helicase RecG
MTENQNIEWKSSWQDEYFKWICGFANAQGGRLIIGKDDRGAIVGLPDVRKLLEDLPNRIRDLLGIVVEVNLLINEGGEQLEIVVPAYPLPISYRGRYYIRSGSTKQELKGAALDRFLLGKLGRRWDDIPVPSVSLDDLDPAAFKHFREAGERSGRVDPGIFHESDLAVLDNLQLREGSYLRHAALLLFHAQPEKFVPGAYVKIGFFRNESDLAYQDEVRGNLFQQAKTTMDLLLTKYMKAYIHYEGIQRVERFLFPRDALREVLLNALVHRDYSTGAPIQIRVYENRIRFSNDGQLPEGWTVERLLQPHSSKPHNPLLAGALFRSGDIESWGRGIDKIRSACQQNETKFPEFQIESTSFTVEFRGIIPMAHAELTGDVTGDVTGEVRSLLAVLVGGPLTRPEIQLKLSLKGQANFRDRYLTPALKTGLVAMTIPDKPRSRAQKYRLTTMGREICSGRA